jgi:hypothetical protein
MFARPAAIFFLAALAGCSTVEPVVALPSTGADDLRREAEFQQEGSLGRLRQQDGRVAAISFRLNVANLDLCADKALLTGMALHHALQYGRADRAVAMRYFALTGRPSVLTVVPDGPADKAGVRAGDALVSIDGVTFTDVGARSERDGPTYDETLRAREQLDKALADGTGTLVIERGGQRRHLTITPVAGCAYEAQLMPSEDLNAWADGRRVFITTAFVRYATTDDQLAIVVGHELGHNVMRHRTRIAEGGTGAILGNAGVMRGGLLTVEREADYVGLYLMARAGFDYGAAQDFWRNYAADFGRSRYAMWSHPGSLERATNIGATAEEIAAKKAAGEPLTPTPARLETAEGG